MRAPKISCFSVFQYAVSHCFSPLGTRPVSMTGVPFGLDCSPYREMEAGQAAAISSSVARYSFMTSADGAAGDIIWDNGFGNKSPSIPDASLVPGKSFPTWPFHYKAQYNPSKTRFRTKTPLLYGMIPLSARHGYKTDRAYSAVCYSTPHGDSPCQRGA